VSRKYIINPVTGALDAIDVAASGGGSYNVDKITLNATNISNKSVTLSATPSTIADTRLIVIEGIEQEFSVDFTVGGATLSWNGLGLDGILADGDKIIVIFN